MSLWKGQREKRTVSDNKAWPDDDVIWVKMLYLDWMSIDDIAERTGIDKRYANR